MNEKIIDTNEEKYYWIEVEQHLTVVAKQSEIVLVGKAIGLILGFISNFIFARYYGPKILG